MASPILCKLNLFILIALLFAQSKGDGIGSIVFLDGSQQSYIRDRPLVSGDEIDSLSFTELAATVSVLLGFAPPLSLPADSSQKLNNILLPDPFNKPHAVFMLEVTGTEDLLALASYSNSQTSRILRTGILPSNKGKVELPGEEISFVNLDEPLDMSCGAACLDGELNNLANWLGGSYVGTIKSLDGRVTVPLASGSTINLHVAKEADLQFLSRLVSLVRNVKNAVEIHDDLAGSSLSISEIMAGRFTGIEVLREVYGETEILRQGMELVEKTIARLFNLLQASYKGKIVGVIVPNSYPSDSGIVVDVTFTERTSRWLAEDSTSNTTASEIILVRRSLAWITGIILLISTFIGIYLLLNMSLTRDTLLYSNVKLD